MARQIFFLTKNGKPPTQRFALKLIEQILPKKRNMHIRYFAGAEMQSPDFLTKHLNARSIVAIIEPVENDAKGAYEMYVFSGRAIKIFTEELGKITRNWSYNSVWNIAKQIYEQGKNN